LQTAPDDRKDAAVSVKVRRACPGDTRVGLLGEGELLGTWDTSQVIPLRRSQTDPDLWAGVGTFIFPLSFPPPRYFCCKSHNTCNRDSHEE
jgi:hypothetical protein